MFKSMISKEFFIQFNVGSIYIEYRGAFLYMVGLVV